MGKIDLFVSELKKLGDGRYSYYNSATGKGIGCSDYVKYALQNAGIILGSETFWAGQCQIGVLADTSRFKKIAWSADALQVGDIMWSQGHHVAVWAGNNSVYEAAPEATHPLAECGTGVGLHKAHSYYNCGTGTLTWTCIYRIIEKESKMITAKELVKTALNVCLNKFGPTVYKNVYPYNVGYWDGSKWSFDCLGFVHTMVNGFNGTKTLGGGAVMDSFVLNCNESQTLASCTIKSSFNGKEPKIGSLLQSGGHVGIYIGETRIDRGNGLYDLYNVAECTPAWSDGCQLSWVDVATGKRFNKKGGTYRSMWSYHGELSRVDYSGIEDENILPEPVEDTSSITVLSAKELMQVAIDVIDGKWGNNPERREKLIKKYGNEQAIHIQDIINEAYT